MDSGKITLYMKLPNHQSAHIDVAKLTGYVLNPNHPEGRHKARIFRSALGISAAHASWLAKTMLHAIGNNEASLQAVTEWGTIYRVEIDLLRDKRCARIRTLWLCGQEQARLVTCFVIGECNENS